MQIIPFQVPVAASITALPYQYVRAVATIVGTSVYIFAGFLMASKFGGLNPGYTTGVAQNI